MRSSLPYNPAFDGLRAIAVLLVLAFHCRVPGFSAGYLGVDLFFVLSGFLITQLLLESVETSGRIDVRQFYLRRFLRLGPPLLLLLLFYVAVAPIAWPQFSRGQHLQDATLVGLYLSDYMIAFWKIPKALEHSWSLSVEEHFYLIWPLAVLLLARCNVQRRIGLLFGLFLLATAWRVFESYHAGWVATYYRFDTRISGLILGALLAACLRDAPKISERTANLIGGAAYLALTGCLAVGYWRASWSLAWLTTLTEMAAAGFVIAASSPKSRVHSILSVPPLVGLGVMSYGFYLWHFPIAVYFREWLPWPEATAITAILAIAAASMSYLTIERPLQRYRRSLGTHRNDVMTSDFHTAAMDGRV